MFKLANKKRLVVFGFCFIFVLSILPLGLTRQLTSYGTGADPPAVAVFEDYSFNESYPPPDASNPHFITGYDSALGSTSGTLADLMVSDDSRLTLTYQRNYYSYDDFTVWSLYVSFTVRVPAGYTGDLYVVFEGYRAGTQNPPSSLQVKTGAYTFANVLNIPATEASFNVSVSSYLVSSGVVTFKVDSNQILQGDVAGSNYVYVDRLYVYIVWGDGKTSNIFAYDFSHTAGWSGDNYGTITSDGDIATFNPTGHFNFDFEGINDPYEVGDDTFIGLSEIENGYDDTNIASDQYIVGKSMKLQMIHAAYTGFEKTDFTDTGNINFYIEYYIRITGGGDYTGDSYYNRFRGADTSTFFIFAIRSSASGDADFMYYNEALGSYVKLQDCLDDTWYHVKLSFDQASKTATVQIGSNTYSNLPFRPSSTGTGLSEIEFEGRPWGGDGFTAWLDRLHISGPSTAGAANDYARFSFTGLNQPISMYVPFVEFYASASDAALYLGSNGFEISSYGRTRRNVYAVAGPATITSLYIYAGGPVKFDYIRFYGLEDYAAESGGVNDSGDVLYNSDDDLITAVEPNEFFSLTTDVSDFNLAVYAYCKIEFSGAATISVTPLDTSGTPLQTLNATTSDDTIHFTAAGTVDKIKLTIYNSTTLYYITFSVMNININAISANYEDTYLSDQQTIIISDVGAVWGDGAAISQSDFRFSIVENATVLQSNISVADLSYTRGVQLYNSTYNIELSWCNDSRYRYWIPGANYSFWIIGSNITTDFEYDFQRLSSGAYLGVFYQSEQMTWANGSVVDNSPRITYYLNGTSKGYEDVLSTGWIPQFRFQISTSYDWINVYAIISKGDFSETVYNVTVQITANLLKHLHFTFYSTYDGLGLADDLLKIYVDGVRVYGMDAYTTGSTVNLTITDYFNRPVYSKAAYSFTPADTVFIDVGLDFYPITFINPGYDTLIVQLTANGVAKNITVPALGISQPYRAIAGTFSIKIYYLTDDNGETKTYKLDKELGDITITSESYNIQLPAHKTRADVPPYPKGGGGVSYSVFYSGLVWTGGIIIAAVIASGIYVKTTRGSTKPLEERIAPEVNIYTPSRYGGNIKRRSVSRNHPSRYGGNRRKNNLEEF